MGIYDRDYMREHAREARKAEAPHKADQPMPKAAPAPRMDRTRKTSIQRPRSDTGPSKVTIAVFWIGVLLLLFAGASLIRPA